MYDKDAEEPLRKGSEILLSPNDKKLSITMAVLFILGEMAGSGILALPAAISKSGWIGLGILFMCGGMACFTGTKLGECWNFILQAHPEYKHGCQSPYPIIAEKAAGVIGRKIANGTVYTTIFGACVVILLLCARNTSQLLVGIFGLAEDNILSYPCFLLIVLYILITPATFQNSPADMPWVAICATATTGLACLLLFAELVLENAITTEELMVNESISGLESEITNTTCKAATTVFVTPCFDQFFQAFGTIVFCFGGMSLFPTIQCNMAEPRKFYIVVLASMSGLLALMLPVAISGYIFYASDIRPNILEQVNPKAIMSILANILITSHLVFAVIILQNPIAQAIEDVAKVKSFGWKRLLIRILVSTAVLMVGLSLPKFDFLLGLVGGTMIMCNTLIFPSVFYIMLVRKNIQYDSKRYIKYDGSMVDITTTEYLIHGTVILTGILAGSLTTYQTIQAAWGENNFISPCFVSFDMSINVNH